MPYLFFASRDLMRQEERGRCRYCDLKKELNNHCLREVYHDIQGIVSSVIFCTAINLYSYVTLNVRRLGKWFPFVPWECTATLSPWVQLKACMQCTSTCPCQTNRLLIFCRSQREHLVNDFLPFQYYSPFKSCSLVIATIIKCLRRES